MTGEVGWAGYIGCLTWTRHTSESEADEENLSSCGMSQHSSLKKRAFSRYPKGERVVILWL